MLEPDGDWYWFCENQYLMLSLSSNLHFQTAFRLKSLLNEPVEKQLFSVDDCERYSTLAETLLGSNLKVSAAELVQVLINGVAALAFHKPVSLRSWYFAEQHNYGAIRQLASLENDQGKGNVLVLEQNDDVSTCMVISKSLMLHANKELAQFAVIKVMKNRLIPFVNQSEVLSQSA